MRDMCKFYELDWGGGRIQLRKEITKDFMKALGLKGNGDRLLIEFDAKKKEARITLL